MNVANSSQNKIVWQFGKFKLSQQEVSATQSRGDPKHRKGLRAAVENSQSAGTYQNLLRCHRMTKMQANSSSQCCCQE